LLQSKGSSGVKLVVPWMGTLFTPLRYLTMANETYNKPSEVVAYNGKVHVDGPDGVDVALTPDAAIETGHRLIEEGARAAGQEREKTIDHRPK
jgi:hypothetical protein